MRPAVSALTFTFIGFIAGAAFFIAASLVLAWTGPTSAPPNGNVSAPINVGTTDQIKNAGMGVNSLAVFGNAIISTVSGYLNFGATSGVNGYGIRDNAGTMEFKSLSGSWTNLAAAGRIPGEIAAFDLSQCPPGWSEYTQARGRFLRRIDNGAGNDPDGTRAPGSVQEDEFKSHTHDTINTGYPRGAWGGNLSLPSLAPGNAPFPTTATGGAETRPKNVAVLFCRKD